MQAAYSVEMEWKQRKAPDAQVRPVRKARLARLLQLIEEFGGPKAVADKIGMKDPHLIACAKGRRGIGDDLAGKLEAKCGKPFGWMDDDGSGWPFDTVSRDAYQALTERQKGAVEGYIKRLLDEGPSLGGSSESPGSDHPGRDAA